MICRRVRKTKKLVLEDEGLTQKIYKAVFSMIPGVEFYFSKNDDEFYKILNKYSFDLFLIDIALKVGKNGSQVINELRLTAKYKSTPIIVVTACALTKDEHLAFEAGVDIFLRKPVDRLKLTLVIKHALSIV